MLEYGIGKRSNGSGISRRETKNQYHIYFFPHCTCCLRPGVPGISDNIEVRSIVGRFLEHNRILCFENGGESEIFLSSADWMPRNLFRRVETCFPLVSPGVKDHVKEILDWFWRDNVKARVMDQYGHYHLVPITGEHFNVQNAFLEDAARRRKAAQQKQGHE